MENLKTLLSSPEGRTLEFKRDLSSLQPILKTIIAFANTAGGILVIGRDDKGNVSGLKDVSLLEEKLANVIHDSIYPPLLPDISIVSFEEKALLLVRIAHWKGPFYLKSQGPKEGVYIRFGSTNRAAGPEFLKELERSFLQVSFDQLPCSELTIEALDMEYINTVFQKVGRSINEEKLVTLGILVPYNAHLVPSNGGLILFGKKELRDRHFPNAQVRCAHFQGVDKVHFIDQYDIGEPIISSLGAIQKFIKRNTRLGATITSLYREDIPEYDSIVLREIVINALVHSDYSIQGMHLRIALFADRMEIESPGMLPFGYTLSDFFMGISHVRNKVIARVFRELRMLEEWGTGYLRVKEACILGNYEVPEWEELGYAIRVILRPHRATQQIEKTGSTKKQLIDAPKKEQHIIVKPANKEKITKKTIEGSTLHQRQKEIVALFIQNKRLSTKEVQDKLHSIYSLRTLRADIFDLKEKGYLKMIGKGPSTFWEYIE